MPNPNSRRRSPYPCQRVSRRTFLADTGMGFTGLALSAMLARDAKGQPLAQSSSALANDQAILLPERKPRARSVIWIFLCGGVSHMESFDPKPMLSRYDGKMADETPFKELFDPQRANQNLVDVNPSHGGRTQLMGLRSGFRRYGQSGLAVSDWFANIGECADDLAVVRSLWTIHNDHGTQLTWHTGRHPREGGFPTIGSWVSYGLGTMNQNLPEYVVLGTPTGDCCGGEWTHGAGYLGPEYAGVRLAVEDKDPLPFVSPSAWGLSAEDQAAEFSLLGRLNQEAGIAYPNDPQLRARIKAYELAFGMQMAVPEALAFQQETGETLKLYGMDNATTEPFAKLCLTARRMVERGVRFVQVFHGGGGGGEWDAHGDLVGNHSRLSAQVDRPIAGLLQDLKRRGLLDETLVVWGTEFGRTPGAQGTGRDHHPNAFCAWLAGGGVRGGVTHGATDELGFYPVESPRYVTDIHATVLHQLGLDPRHLDLPDRRRLDQDHGRPIHEILS